MAATRFTSPKRVFRRYKFFFYAAVFMFILQLFVGYHLYTIYQNENSTYLVSDSVHSLSRSLIDRVNYGILQSRHFDNVTLNTYASTYVTVTFRDTSWPYHDFYHDFYRDLVTIFQVYSHNKLIPRVKWEVKQVINCHVTSDEALSAISRAKTGECKQLITNTACLSQARQLYHTSLPRHCPLKNTNDAGLYQGCYKDNHQERDLSAGQLLIPLNSPQRCVNHCFNIGKRYAGVQYTTECWCGQTYGKHGRLPEDHCSLALCPGNASHTCGGYLANRVFGTGIESRILRQVPMTNTSYIALKDPVRILYLLTVNGRALRQVHRLLRAIYHKDHYYFIHVDVRQEYLFRELNYLETTYPNIRLSKERLATIWGGASLLTVHLKCLKLVLEITSWTWDYVLNLSESDFPVKDNEALVTFLTTYRGFSFLKSHGSDTARFIKKQGLDKTFVQCENRMWRLGERPLPSGVIFDGGSDWVCLHRDFVRYVTQSGDLLVTGLIQLFTFALLPSESFFHTVLQNSAFCHTIVNNNLHLTNWRRKQGCKCQHKHIVDWCGCSPNDFQNEDLAKLMKTTREAVFFARKFEAIVNQEIINTLENIIYRTGGQDVASYSRYWQNDYHHLDTQRNTSDTLLTIYKSLTRLGMAHLHTHCHDLRPHDLQPGALREVTLYNIHDSFEGLLVKSTVSGGYNESVVMEIHARPIFKFTNLDTPYVTDRLITLQVGTDFDLKELILRNYARIVGPHSSLVLLHSWRAGTTLTFTAMWLDPTDLIAASYDIDVPASAYVGNHNPYLRTPLRPGVWRVKVLIRWKVVAEVSFMVVPYTEFGGDSLTESEVVRNHNGPAGLYGQRDFSDFMSVMSLHDNRDELVRRAATNGRRLGAELEAWCDELVAQFWRVEGVCVSGTGRPGNCGSLEVCEHTVWSSLSPDPKSMLKPVSQISGLIR